jgi:hypothetical protein
LIIYISIKSKKSACHAGAGHALFWSSSRCVARSNDAPLRTDNVQR